MSAGERFVVEAESLRGNEGQWRAFMAPGNCVILAGPGSGKTKTITLKMAQLLHDQVRKPRRLACITYSNACVGELRARLKKLGVEGDERVVLATVHSFCLTEIVVPFARLAGIAIPEPIVIAAPAEARRMFTRAYEATVGGTPNASFRTACERIRRSVPDRNTAEWAAVGFRQRKVVESYEALLLENGVIDFDGLVLTGLKLVESFSWVRAALRAKYPVLVVDEYQDLGLPLHRIVVALLASGVRVVAVGDPDQSIYGFTGAKPGLLRELAKRPDVTPVQLKLNYRCADRIIEASKTLVPQATDYRSHDGRPGEIVIVGVGKGVDEQASFALRTVVPQLLKENPEWKPGDIAVLYRTMREGQAVADSADAMGTTYFRLDGGSPVRKTRLTEWLIEAARWCSGGWTTGAVTLSSLFRGWRRLRPSRRSESAVLTERKDIVLTLFAQRGGKMSLRAWLEALHRGFLGAALATETSLSDEAEVMLGIMEASRRGALATFSLEVFANQGRSPDLLNLITLHSSKGLEFEAVVMLGLEKGEFPSDLAQTQEDIDESARLFYVGVTRAKSKVFLLYDREESPFITAIRRAV